MVLSKLLHGERIPPAKAWEAFEVGICGVEVELMLNREGSEVGIGGEIPSGAGDPQEIEEDLAMVLAR